MYVCMYVYMYAPMHMRMFPVTGGASTNLHACVHTYIHTKAAPGLKGATFNI